MLIFKFINTLFATLVPGNHCSKDEVLIGYHQGAQGIRGECLQAQNLILVNNCQKLKKLLGTVDILQVEILPWNFVDEADHRVERLVGCFLHLDHLPSLLHGAKEHPPEHWADTGQEEPVGSNRLSLSLQMFVC